MDAVERAIRNALEKGNAEDAVFRERVYRSAFAALERSLAQRSDLEPEAANRQRGNLQAKITDIESEFIPAAPAPAVRQAAARPAPRPEAAAAGAGRPDPAEPRPAAPEAAAPEAEPPQAAQPEPGGPPAADRSEPPPVTKPEPPAAPSPAPPTDTEPEFVPWVDADEDPRRQRRALRDDEVTVADADRPAPTQRRRPRRAIAWLFLAVTLVAAIGMGVWWTIDSGLLMSAEERDGAVPNPPLVLEEENFEPEASGSPPPLSSDPVRPVSDWLTIFTPSDPTTVSAPAGATAEVMTEDDQTFLRVGARSAEAAVSFDVGRGVLEQLADGKAVFSFLLRAEEGEEKQISVSCDFGALGDCGRRRYVVGFATAEYLLEVELPEAGSLSDGTIRIVPDIAGGGGALDIFEIKAAVSRTAARE